MATPVQIGVTIGDPGGIGAEVALKALAAPGLPSDAAFRLIGPGAHWRRAAGATGLADALGRWAMVETADPFGGLPVPVGETSARHGRVAIDAIELGVRQCLDGRLDAIVTAPLSKEGLHAAGSPFPGHTEMLGALAGIGDTTMAFVGGGLRLALATIHVPLRRVFEMLTPELILAKGRHLHEFARSLGVERPRIGVCGLNPHASEGGLFGDEEARIIAPAIERARAAGMDFDGPHPPDTIFWEARRGRFDAVLSMYHDQGLIALKTIAFDSAVNVTLGLPFIRTSPDHGTAFNIAGRNIARPDSMRAAIELAIDLARRRRTTT